MKTLTCIALVICSAFFASKSEIVPPQAALARPAAALVSQAALASGSTVNQAAADAMALRVPRLAGHTVTEVALLSEEADPLAAASLDYVAFYKRSGSNTYKAVVYDQHHAQEFSLDRISAYTISSSGSHHRIVMNRTDASGRAVVEVLVLPGRLQLSSHS